MPRNSLLKFQSAIYVWLENKPREEHNKDSKLCSLLSYIFHSLHWIICLREEKNPDYCRRDRM